MATSSIFANFDIMDGKKANVFVKALEKSENDAVVPATNTKGKFLRTQDEIGKFFGVIKTKRVSK